MSLPTPEVRPSQVRPSQVWYAVGGVAIAMGVGFGVALIVWGAVSLFPTFTAEIPAGTQQTVQLDDAGEWSLYGAVTGSSRPRGLQGCHIQANGDGRVSASGSGFNASARRGGRQWYWVDSFMVSAPGEYTFDCAEGGNVDRYAVGPNPNLPGFVGRLGGGIAALLGGLAIGLIILIVTAVRRSSARARLRGSDLPYAQPPGLLG